MQTTIEFGVCIVDRKTLDWCTPFSGVNLCYEYYCWNVLCILKLHQVVHLPHNCNLEPEVLNFISLSSHL